VRKTETGLSLSATDLSNSAACRQLTGLDMSVVLEGRKRPYRNDPLGDILAERGLAHEKAYIDHLKAQGRKVLDLSAIKDPADAAAATLEAMSAGQDVIVQGALLDDGGRWYGRPDVLLRTEKRGTWPWSYEAVDTKLAQETRGTTILQLSFYSDLLSVAQGAEAERFHVVTPKSGPAGETYRTADYAAWFRSVRARGAAILAMSPQLFEPECKTPRQMRLANALCRFREIALRPLAVIARSPSECAGRSNPAPCYRPTPTEAVRPKGDYSCMR